MYIIKITIFDALLMDINCTRSEVYCIRYNVLVFINYVYEYKYEVL